MQHCFTVKSGVFFTFKTKHQCLSSCEMLSNLFLGYIWVDWCPMGITSNSQTRLAYQTRKCQVHNLSLIHSTCFQKQTIHRNSVHKMFQLCLILIKALQQPFEQHYVPAATGELRVRGTGLTKTK